MGILLSICGVPHSDMRLNSVFAYEFHSFDQVIDNQEHSTLQEHCRSERHQYYLVSLIRVKICNFREMAFRSEHGPSGTRLNEHAGMVATLCQTPLGTSGGGGGGRKSKWSSELWTGRPRDFFSQKSKRGTTSDVYSTLSGFTVSNFCRFNAPRIAVGFLSQRCEDTFQSFPSTTRHASGGGCSGGNNVAPVRYAP